MVEFKLTRPAVHTLVTEWEYANGMTYANAGLVTIVDINERPGQTDITGIVRNVYVTVQLELNEHGVQFSSLCDAHNQDTSCLHCAALLIELTNESGTGFQVSDSPNTRSLSHSTKRMVPNWQRALERLLPQFDAAAPVAEEQLGLLLKVELTKSYRGPDNYSIQARPARQGARSPWVQTGVSWRDLMYDARFPREQRLAVYELSRLRDAQRDYDNYWNEDWVSLSMLPTRELMEALTRIRESGVAIVNGASQRLPINFSELPAEGFVDLRKTEAGLLIEGRLRGPEGKDVHLIPFGSPPNLVLFADTSLVHAQEISLAEFVPAIAPELFTLIEGGPMLIPTDQVPDFENSYISRMRHLAQLRSTDDSYKIPKPARPVLRVELDSVSAPLLVTYKWHYSDSGARQPEVEREILQSVEDKLGGEDPLGKITNGIFPTSSFEKSRSIEFVMYTLPLLREHPDIQISELSTVPDYKLAGGPTKVSVNVGEASNDWFDLGITVTLDGLEIPFVELFAALSAGEEYLVLDDHTVIPIDGDEFHQLRQLISEAGELAEIHPKGVRMHRLSIDWWQELVNLGIIETQEHEWLSTMSQLTDASELESVQLPDSFKAQLRPYQAQGVAWLNFLRTHSLGGVLADDMGLGKTVQLLACLDVARVENPNQKFLVIAPTSVVGNWTNEAARFAPELRTCAISQTSKKSGMTIQETIGDAQLVITSYTIFRLGYEEFEKMGFDVLIMDEAQQLKNHTSKGYKQVRQLPVPCKLVVTGTPMENNLTELWALVAVAAPGLLGGLKAFKDNYQKPVTSGDVHKLNRLKKRLRPFVLRRTKEQVVPELPEKTEQVLEVELEPAHRKAYDRRFARVRQEILGLVTDVDSNRFRILQSLTLLRQLALDPSLVDEGNGPSAKLELLRELISDAVAEGHKILVFSQFTSFLGKARDVIAELDIPHGYLDGSTTGAKRKQLIDGFTDGEFPVFFISLKSGGFGINLTTADYCILLDPWWNPQAEAQAIDRTHRIGQTKPVYVYRLVAKDTIESKVLELQSKKTALFNDVLGEDSDVSQSGSLNVDDFLSLME